jgi:predicted O-methyltransferase YrrM
MKGNAAIHFLKYLIKLDSATTQTSTAERAAMASYLATSASIIEIGVFEGFNTREFALLSPQEARIFAIDPFFKGFFGFNYGKFIALKEWQKHGISHKIEIIEGFSWDVIDQIPFGIDFIFIDGDHSFEGVKKDFELYSNLLSENGVIALHDARLFSNGWTKPNWGPVRLVEEIIKPSDEWKIVEEIDSLVLIKKQNT